MSTSAISAQAHAVLPDRIFAAHRRDARAAAGTEGTPGVGKPGQLPVGTGQGLLANAVQSLQQAASSRTSGAPALIGGSLNVTA
jgi:hypothetical protein